MPFDFSAVTAPFRMQPGLRRLAPGATQLTPYRPGNAALGEKLAVLSNHASQALVGVSGFDAAPAIAALGSQAAREHPDAFAIGADGTWSAHHLGWSLRGEVPQGNGPGDIGDCLRALPAAWRRPALLCLAFAEDFAVIDGANAHIPWLAVCLPSHWSPQEKVGRHFAEVHAPVADNQVLLTASEHLARLVTGSERWERFVWTITPSGALDHHPQRCGTMEWADDSEAFLRTERQTFIPLPEHRQAVFTIHVEVQRLADAVQTVDHARRMHDAIASMSPAVLAYRNLAVPRERLLNWLAERAAAAR
jgi:hypothetical protein